jgi:hypothetical protein
MLLLFRDFQSKSNQSLRLELRQQRNISHAFRDRIYSSIYGSILEYFGLQSTDMQFLLCSHGLAPALTASASPGLMMSILGLQYHSACSNRF